MSGVGHPLKRYAGERSMRLNAGYVVLFLGALTLVAAVIQVALGANLAVLALALMCIAEGLWCFTWLGIHNLGAWLALFYILGNVLVALFAKTVLGQPLDSYLFAPALSFFVLSVTVTSLVGALVLIRMFYVGRTILRPTEDQGLLRFLSWACFALGVLFWYVNRSSKDPTGSGFGGVAAFRDLLLMAIIARTAYTTVLSCGARNLDAPLALIIVASVVMGFIDNSKTNTALPIVSYFASILFFGGRLRGRHFVGVIFGSILFVSFATPMINAYRKLGVVGMSITQRASLFKDSFASVFEQGQFGQFERLAESQFTTGYYHYFGGGRGQMILGRFASIQQIDPVVAAIDKHEPLGGSAVWPAFGHLVPKFLYPDKPEGVEAYKIVSALGLYDPLGGKYPTLPLVGQAYAAYGMVGVIIIPFMTFLTFLLVLKKLGWSLNRNVYAIFILCQFIVVFGSQGDFSQYIGEIFRTLPIFTSVFLLLGWIYRISHASKRQKLDSKFTRVNL